MTDARYHEALALHRQSRFAEAAAAYEQVLAWQPRHVQALTFLGVIAFQLNQFERAAAFAGRALEIDPQSAATHLIEARSLVGLKRFEAAIASCERALKLKPDLVDAHLLRANALQQLGRGVAACSSYDDALAWQPYREDILNDRGNALRTLKRYDAALTSYGKAIEAAPGMPEPYFNRGLALYELGRFEAALDSYDRAIALNPNYVEAHDSRGTALKDLHRLGAALDSYDRAIAIKGDYVQAHVNRGNLLSELGRFEEALASYDFALRLSPQDPHTHCNRGNLLGELGRHQEALQGFEAALAIDANHAQTHFSRAFVLLLLGDFARGWREFEWRWQNEHCATSKERRAFSKPLWRGEDPRGKTILVHCEQGLGDTIQFCRYLELIAAQGARVILETPQPLTSLLACLRGVSQRVELGAALPPFDYYCPLMSLPLAFQTTVGTIPSSVPYLRADAEHIEAWRMKLGARTGPRVGLVWSGGFRAGQPELWSVNDRRNIPLRKLAPLCIPGIEFFSLQKGEAAEAELALLDSRHGDGPAINNHAGDLRDFSDTAALIEQLDLVISVDTSTAHLAAAMGKPVWLLNRFDTCWRWMLDRTDSPWYPTLRLYRQERRGDWETVVVRVRSDLECFAGEVGQE